MRGSHNKTPPQEFVAWLELESDDWKPSYPFDDKSVRSAVVQSLLEHQRGLCVYCGRLLDLSDAGKTFHIEHFRPQHEYKELSVNFENLYLSCGQANQDGGRSQTCGTKKDRWFDEDRFIEPTYPACALSFYFNLNGSVEPVVTDERCASKMIEVLNPNHRELTREREEVLKLLDSGELDVSDFWDVEKGMAESLAHVAYQHSSVVIP